MFIGNERATQKVAAIDILVSQLIMRSYFWNA